MRYNLFIGRYQSPHKGHMHIFNTYLSQGQPVLIAIRDIEPDEQNPLNAAEVQRLWEAVYKDNELVKVIIIPDIASVNYGRGVGYEINQIDVPGAVSAISATEIRRQVKEGKHEWKELVDENIHEMLSSLLRSK
jgi:nicotinamide mononucleotide adenylyltransferase